MTCLRPHSTPISQLTLVAKVLVTVVLDEVGAGALLVQLHTPVHLVQAPELDHREGLAASWVLLLLLLLLLHSSGILVHILPLCVVIYHKGVLRSEMGVLL